MFSADSAYGARVSSGHTFASFVQIGLSCVRSGRLSTGFARLAKFPDLALDESVQIVNPDCESLGVCFPSNPLNEFNHLVTIFWSHHS